ncbi:hypothetical protein GPL15_13215 [Clostridium sp. MCC353]|uniref:hypothetical protein n=1 Tax=Clostridium sp. MCC353 TaxID=2592646 RepID=UPI001C0147D9|nr:hypothetical protein [Clostridium sp. MCC353]MBT9777464.1 hypothetical protein [Clostridium sp. MCC353]
MIQRNFRDNVAMITIVIAIASLSGCSGSQKPVSETTLTVSCPVTLITDNFDAAQKQFIEFWEKNNQNQNVNVIERTEKEMEIPVEELCKFRRNRVEPYRKVTQMGAAG